MSAIITDQFRILNVENFIASIASTSNSYYSFVGLTNSTDYSSTWEQYPIPPIDSFDSYNDCWDTIIALKKISSDDIRPVIRRIEWKSGATYDMYRHDVSRNKLSNPSNKTSLYESNFYVMNSDYRVYICLHNGVDPENPEGKPSLDEPTFTDLEPRSASTSGDGYIWKYLYTIKPSDIVKFDSLNFIPVPKDWTTGTENALVRDHASSPTTGQLKIAIITNRGSGLGANKTFVNVPIIGDGTGAKATIIVGNDSTVESITITEGGTDYTYATVDLKSAGITGDILPTFEVIIPPQGGHGSNIYRELGARSVLIYSRIENDDLNPDFIVGNKIARVGIIKNPLAYNSVYVASQTKLSNTYAIKLTGNYDVALFPSNSTITQTISTGQTASGRVISYDNKTGVLKYWQDRAIVGFSTGSSDLNNITPEYGYDLIRFESSSNSINGELNNLLVDTSFTGVSTVINNRTYNLGQYFEGGLANPEVKKYTGDIIHIDNRPSITRSLNQKEDIKIILQF